MLYPLLSRAAPLLYKSQCISGYYRNNKRININLMFMLQLQRLRSDTF